MSVASDQALDDLDGCPTPAPLGAGEVWRPARGWDRYEVSDRDRVRWRDGRIVTNHGGRVALYAVGRVPTWVSVAELAGSHSTPPAVCWDPGEPGDTDDREDAPQRDDETNPTDDRRQ